MGRFTYIEMFSQQADIYRSFDALVDNAGTLRALVERAGYLEGVRSVLSIGAGEGAFELDLAARLGIEFGVVEPAKVLFDACMAAAAAQDLSARCVEATLLGFEDYKPTRRFDLVVALQSWYSQGKDAAALDKALACVEPGGRLIIALISERSLAARFGVSAGRSERDKLSAESLSAWAHDAGYAHELVYAVRKVPAARFVSEGALTNEARKFASFLCFTPWDDLERERREHIRDTILRAAAEGDITLPSGCLVFRRPLASA